MTRADRFHGAGAVALALMPLAMALANRSSPLVVGIAAALFLAGRVAEGRADLTNLLLRPLRTPLGLCALTFLAWCCVSLAWSPFPRLSLRVLGEFAPTLAAAYVLARAAPGRLPAFTAPLAALAVIATALVITLSLLSGLAPQKALGQRVAEFVFNRPALTLSVLVGPLALVLWRRNRPILSWVTLAFGMFGILRSVSGAAALGMIAGSVMFVLARGLPGRAAIGLAGLGLGLAVALAPVEGDLLHRYMPEAAHARLVQSSSRARVVIARSFGSAVAADPWRGAGYGVAPRFAETSVAARVEPEMRVMLAVGHPHNSFLQIWAELGLVGAILAASVLMLTLRSLGASRPLDRSVALGLVAAAASIAFVEHGAWAAWWTAGLGAAITWLRQAATLSPSSLDRIAA